jgi:hypothetical protein
LHVLSIPPAFILSQDQTLHGILYICSIIKFLICIDTNSYSITMSREKV